MRRSLTPLAQWRETVGRQFLKLDFTPLDDAPFRAEIAPLLVTPDVQVYRSSMSAGLTFRDEQLVRDGVDSYSLIYGLGSKLHVSHRQRDVSLAPGQPTLLHNCTPGAMGAARPFDYVAVILAPRVLADVGAISPLFTGVPWLRTSPPLRLLKAYLGALGSGGLVQGEMGETAGRHIADLVRLAAAREAKRAGEDVTASVKEVQIEVALAAIAARFAEPGLSLAQVAAAAQVSPRQLQRLFEIAGIRFVEHLVEVRLAQALATLTDPRRADWRISDVALSCGFSDVSHFNRCFRRRYGATPTAVRGGHPVEAPLR